MLVRLISDTHFDFGHDYEPLLPPMPGDEETILVVAGDIDIGSEACDNFLPAMCYRFAEVIYVLGNHEFYHNDMTRVAIDVQDMMNEFPNFIFLDNDTVVLGDVRFIGSTLWTSLGKRNPGSMFYAEKAMADYGLIKRAGKKLTALDTVELHEEAVAFIEETLMTPHEGPTIVVTHHLPSYKSVHEMFKTGTAMGLNPAFFSDLDGIMHDHDIAYWFHGHSHQTVEDYEIAGTKVRMNPCGYQALGKENPLFNPEFRIKL